MSLIGSTDLATISKSISDTAVDIFIYDTRKDSDGGAWRKRTQHTSWYNETLNTSTRGSRKEFPAVAVIVAESGQVTIYDGDDPDLPMWMVFNVTGGGAIFGDNTNVIQSVVCLNGWMSVGLTRPSTTGNLSVADFIGDQSGFVYNNASDIRSQGNIADRNSTSQYPGGTSNFFTNDPIVNRDVNDVAMTVLPNAPIDANTGLPVPTIAVATAGGVSVIKDDGNIYDFTNATTPLADYISFTDDNRICFFVDDAGGQRKWVQIFDIPNSDTSYTFSGSGNNYYATYNLDGVSSRRPALAPGATADTNNDGITFKQNVAVADPKGLGVGTIDRPAEDPNNNMVFYSTSEYNTGWMHGDIKLATLSDTDDTNVTSSELNTDPNFDSGVGIFTAATGTVTHSSGTITSTKNSGGTSAMTSSAVLTIGKTYYIEFEITATSPGYTHINSPIGEITSGQVGTHSGTFVATSTDVIFGQNNGGSTSSVTFTRISISLAEADRSVNANGLQVFGTVNKSAVATGADLVAYSGFAYSSGNYLKQPYNSDLDFGTGDFCFMGWANITTTSGDSSMLASVEYSGGTAPDDGDWLYRGDGGSTNIRFYIRDSGVWSYVQASSGIVLNTWQHHCVVRQDGITTIYVNGAPIVSSDNLGGKPFNSKATGVTVGSRFSYSGEDTKGSLALWRISATVPSPEQIKKIYEDEKVLFQENAKATLYGSSDTVTALAYDDSTDLLHVGTSAGRSVFQGLRRVDNTTDAVGVAISASNGMVADD